MFYLEMREARHDDVSLALRPVDGDRYELTQVPAQNVQLPQQPQACVCRYLVIAAAPRVQLPGRGTCRK